jgi:hypothetical protein
MILFEGLYLQTQSTNRHILVKGKCFTVVEDPIGTIRYGCVGRLVVVIDVNPSHGFWTTRLIKVFGHEGQCTCIYNTHEWIVYIMLFLVVCGTSRGSSWLRRNEFLKMTK